jgi:dihydroorotase
MPNLNPVPDSVENLKAQLDIIKSDAVINVYPYASITVGQKGQELSDFDGMAKDSIAFSDDGRGVQDEGMMREAMYKAKALGKMIVAHCEVNALLNRGYIHDGEYAKAHGHRGICSESEWAQVERDLKLADETGCPYHVCHISAKETVSLIRDAKKSGVNVTCETGPHYLVLDDSDLMEHGRFKMNPPLRSRTDKEALIEGICDGTIEMIATYHAPHSAEEKAKGLENSAFGIVGIETALPVMYTHLVKTGILTYADIVRLMTDAPRRRFGITADPGFSVWVTDEKFTVDPARFLTKGRATPFEGDTLAGVCYLTYKDGKVAYKK